MSTQQEDSTVMQELQKGKKGIFGYLPTTELNKAIKESQQKIFYNSQIKQRDIKEQQNARNDEIVNKIFTNSLTLQDIEREMNIPEENGGLPRNILLKYKDGIQRGIKNQLDFMLKEKTDDKEPTKRAMAIKQYIELIDAFVDDNTDKWYARDKLAQAYADGIINPSEAAVLNSLKNNLNDIKFNRNSGPINSLIKAVKSSLNKNNASDDEIALRIKQLIGVAADKQANLQESAKSIMQQHIYSKIPEAQTFPAEGQLMVDANGNKAIVYPDGTVKPYIEKPKTENKTQEEKK
jgi:hypothetical protein